MRNVFDLLGAWVVVWRIVSKEVSFLSNEQRISVMTCLVSTEACISACDQKRKGLTVRTEELCIRYSDRMTVSTLDIFSGSWILTGKENWVTS